MTTHGLKETHTATLDVCLGGVFVPRGETIPEEIYAAWRLRLTAMGLDDHANGKPRTREPIR